MILPFFICFLTGEKIVILVCGTCPLKSEDDDTTVRQTIERIISKQGKGFIACLTNGKLSVDADALVQLLTSPTPQSNPRTNHSRGFQEKISDATGSAAESTYSGQSQSDPLQNPSNWQSGHGWNAQNAQQPTPQAAATNQQMRSPATSENEEPVLLRTILRYGKVSWKSEDLQMWNPDFTVPENIRKRLFQEYQDVPEAGVRIVLDSNHEPKSYVDTELKEFSRKKEIQMERNETLLLKTRLCYGEASFKENDVHYRYANWQIPPHIAGSLKEKHKSTAVADVIISSKDGKLRCKVKIGKKDKITNIVTRELSVLSVPFRKGKNC